MFSELKGGREIESKSIIEFIIRDLKILYFKKLDSADKDKIAIDLADEDKVCIRKAHSSMCTTYSDECTFAVLHKWRFKYKKIEFSHSYNIRYNNTKKYNYNCHYTSMKLIATLVCFGNLVMDFSSFLSFIHCLINNIWFYLLLYIKFLCDFICTISFYTNKINNIKFDIV